VTDIAAGYRSVHSRAVLAGVLLIIAAAPVPLGSGPPQAGFLLAMLIYGLLCLWGAGRLVFPHAGHRPAAHYRILAGLLLWLGLLYLQTIALPESVVETLAPFASSARDNLALISVATPSTLSIDPGQTYNELLKYGAYVALFFLVLVESTDRRRLYIISTVLIAAGVGEALLGLYAGAVGWAVFSELGGADTVSAGTFVDPDHFANLLMLALCLAVGVLTGLINSQPEPDRLRPSQYSRRDLWLGALLCTSGITMIAAIVAVRAWAAVAMAGVAFALMLAAARRVKRARTGEFLLAPAIITVAAVAAGTVLLSLGLNGLLPEHWFAQSAFGISMLWEVWLTGVGSGNYQWAFQMFRNGSMGFAAVDHAHNDYIESAIEQGLPALLVLGAAVGMVLREMLRGYAARRNASMRGIVFGCASGLVFMLLHSLVHYNFRMPANAVYFFVIAALGLAACRIDRGRRAAMPAG